MGLRTSFDILSRVVEEYESRGCPVQNVEVRTVEHAPGRLEATLQFPVSFRPAADSEAGLALEPTAATPAGADGVRIEFSTPVLTGLDEATADAVRASVEETVVTEDGILLTVGLVVDPNSVAGERRDGDEHTPPREDAPAEDEAVDPPDEDATPAVDLAAVRDPSLPPYEDTGFLQALYDSCDTFAEMNRHLDMEVSTETVRRYMIDAGVHTATPYATSEADDPSTTDDRDDEDGPTALTIEVEEPTEQTDRRVGGPSVSDGPGEGRETDEGFPDGLTTEEVVDAVQASVSLYQVQRRLGLDRRTTRELLDEFDLLEFVYHRIGADPRDETSTAELVERIERARAARNDDRPVA